MEWITAGANSDFPSTAPAPSLCICCEVVAVQLLSHVWFFVTPWTAACQASLSFTISQSVLKLILTESMMPSNNLILCCPLLLLCSICPSIRVFFWWVGSSHQGAQVLELQLQHQSFQWIFRVDFLRMDWFALLQSKGLSRVFSRTHGKGAVTPQESEPDLLIWLVR